MHVIISKVVLSFNEKELLLMGVRADGLIIMKPSQITAATN
jgi:hypothetical protein